MTCLCIGVRTDHIRGAEYSINKFLMHICTLMGKGEWGMSDKIWVIQNDLYGLERMDAGEKRAKTIVLRHFSLCHPCD